MEKKTNYIVTQATNILASDDINVISWIRRFNEENKDKPERFSVFRKFNTINALNSKANIYNVASIITSIYITNASRAESDDFETINIYGCMYMRENNPNIFVEMVLDENIENAGGRLHKKMNSYGDVVMDTVNIFQVGKVIKCEDNTNLFDDKKFVMKIDENKISSFIIKEGIDAFNEYNRKLYVCEVIEPELTK